MGSDINLVEEIKFVKDYEVERTGGRIFIKKGLILVLDICRADKDKNVICEYAGFDRTKRVFGNGIIQVVFYAFLLDELLKLLSKKIIVRI